MAATDRERDDSSRARQVFALALTLAAIVLFVVIGTPAMLAVVRSLRGVGVGPDRILCVALLLDIALLFLGWRRYEELKREVEERRESEEQARMLAEIDPLTGCLNRRSIGAATDRLIADAKRRGEVVAFVMVDIDNFKQLNDFNGHGVGDLVLQECARRIRGVLPEQALMARIGGDEFACVIAFDRRHPERVDRIASAIIEAVAKPIEMEPHAIDTTVSLGLTRNDQHDPASAEPCSASTLLHMADIAMYHAKKQGRNRHFWFEPSMESELRFRMELETGIRRGIPRGEFVPYYEQQVDIETGRLLGFEMLARWQSPTLGLVSPEVFIPVAEEIGAIGDLSESLIRQALDDAKGWNADLTLSVNISPVQLRDPWFAQKLLRLLVEANFPPARLNVEITESCLHDNVGMVRTLIASLRNQGIRVSLDDFGTGYSALSQLRTLPFDHLKIDRTFIANIADSPDSATIVQAITAIGTGLGLPITVEGVESEAVLKELRQIGKFNGQGYLYGRPEPASAVAQLLAGLGLLATPAAQPEGSGIEGPGNAPDSRSASAGLAGSA